MALTLTMAQPAGGRFVRVARDLEKLPPELIEPVIADLELQAVIRLAQHGGPRLIWAIENSPKWRPYMQTRRVELQQLLTVTDQYQNPNLFPPSVSRIAGLLDYLHGSHYYSNFPAAYPDADALIAKWLPSLESHVRRKADTHDFAKLATLLPPADSHTLTTIAATTTPLTPPHMSTFLSLRHTARLTRASLMSAELRRLAALVATRPTYLREPFAPQVFRTNPAHLPFQLRADAKRIELRARTVPDLEPAGFRFCHAYPALVPYDWCLWLFVRVVGSPGTSWPVELTPSVRIAVEGIARFFEAFGEGEGEVGNKAQVRTIGTPWSVGAMPEVPAWEVIWNGGTESKKVGPAFLTLKWGREYWPHPEGEVKWLEAFVECVAWMEESFPKLVDEVRGVGWVEEGEEAKKVVREERRERRVRVRKEWERKELRKRELKAEMEAEQERRRLEREQRWEEARQRQREREQEQREQEQAMAG